MKTGQCLLLAVFVLVLTSCVHREFDYESSKNAYLDVVFDWQNDPDANPQTMSLYMFPENGGKPLRFEFVGRDGGSIRIAPGSYHAICINSDEREIYFRGNESHSTFEVTTDDATSLTFGSALNVRSFELPRAGGTESQRMAAQPPMLWSASHVGFAVETSDPDKRADKELRMYPRRIVDTYVVTVKNITNADKLDAMNATISSMADGFHPAAHKPNNVEATIPIELSHSRAESSAQGRFLTFGHCPDTRRSHRLMIYAVMRDNSKYYFEFDVTDQAHMPPDADGIHHIVVEKLDLPQSSEGGSGTGMNPSVDQWQDVDIGIEM